MTMEMRSAHFGVPHGVRNKSHRNSAGLAWERHKHHEPPETDSEDNSDSPGNTTVKGLSFFYYFSLNKIIDC